MWFLNGSSHYFYKNTNTFLDKYIFFLKKKIFLKDNVYFIAHTQWMYRNALKLIKKEKIFLCKYYPIDTELFRPRNKEILKKKFNIQTKKKIILFSAQNINDPRKGQLFFYKLLKYFSIKKKFYFIIVGKGTLDEKYKQFDNISHFSFLKRKKMAEVYALSDIYVCTSIIDNLPLTVLEAMSSGLVVVAFDSGGIKEVLGKSGYIIYKKNYIKIIKILNQLSDKLIFNKSRMARDFALKNFSYKKFKDSYIKIINKIYT
jgi:glycosyltransferase involved in cell wall biosynthesis